MADGILFQSNPHAGALFVAALTRGYEVALKDAEKVLKGWGEEWKTRVQRVTPVATGHARQSWFVAFERTGNAMIVTLYNTVKGVGDYESYVFYLEHGTDRIAKGRVKAWQPGQPPIMDWPAKNEQLPSLTGIGPGHKNYERHVDILTNAFTSGQGEQMPMLRPIGYEIAPKVEEDVATALLHGFKAAVEQRKG